MNFLGPARIMAIISAVVDNVDAVVRADLDMVGEGDSDDILPSFKRSLSVIHRELQTIQSPCHPPVQKCIRKM
jgi:hypothetical protein